jgi:hypothetical protein
LFSRVHQYLRVNRRAECHVQRNVDDDENIIDTVERSPRTSTRRISAHLNVPRVRVRRSLHRRIVSVPHPAHSTF